MKKFNTELEVYEELAKYEDKSIGEIAGVSGDLTNKAYVGHIIEERIFEYKPNSKSAPDIENLGLEVKTTPVKSVNGRYVSKERLVLNIINYCNENWNNILESSFWRKNKNLLIIFYEYFLDKKPNDFKLLKSIIYKYPEEDFEIIKNDWEIISKKVLNGKAHEISEKDTLYLAACTKGASSDSVQKQPFSDIVAKQRAYSLKSSYMTTVFNDYVLQKKSSERIINTLERNKIGFNFYNYVFNKFKPYFGRKNSELLRILNIDANIENKSINSVIIKNILGIKGKVENVDEFKKAGIIPKTIRVEENGKIRESMSFPTFKFTDLILEEWEDSDLYNTLVNYQFLFIIFQKSKGSSDYVLQNILFWSMNDKDLNECKTIFEKTKKVIFEGVKVTKFGNKYINNFPKQRESKVMHVRPHAVNRLDTYPLPNGTQLTKQCFWLNRKYIESIINGEVKSL